MPELGVYFVNPASRDAIAAALMCSGVSKSGSPAPKPQTSIPSAFMALALESMLRVSEGVRIVARLASSMDMLVLVVNLTSFFSKASDWEKGGVYLPNQLSISGFKL